MYYTLIGIITNFNPLFLKFPFNEGIELGITMEEIYWQLWNVHSPTETTESRLVNEDSFLKQENALLSTETTDSGTVIVFRPYRPQMHSRR